MSGLTGDARLQLVGRERELAALHAALDAALAGRGSLVLIGGEAGIGKTALAETLLAEATARGALTLVGRCYDLSETPPYGPWAEALARAPAGDGLPALPTAVQALDHGDAAMTSQEAIFRHVRDYLAALTATQPIVLLLDDLHWADPASLDLVRVLARGLAGMSLLLLAAYRVEEVAWDHPLTTLLPILVRESHAARLDLRPLDRAAISTLVTARYGLDGAGHERLLGYLARRTEGNALFLGELLRTLEGEATLDLVGDRWIVGNLEQVPVPTLLRQVIEGRVHHLAPETGRLLAVAAVIGQGVPLALWAALGGVVEADLLDHAERAIAARLLAETPDGGGVRFAHALIREALYEGTPALRRRALHRQVGEVLAAAPGPDPDAVANQFQRAGDPRAVAWLVRAGLRAHDRGATRTAAARFVAAAVLLAEDAAHVRERGWLLLLGGRLLTFADTDAALRHLDEAEGVARRVGDLALAAYICGARGIVLCHRPRDLRAGVAESERAVAAVEALPHEYRRWSGIEVALARVGALLPAGEGTILPTRARALPVALHPCRNLANQYGFIGRYREARALGEATVAAALEDDPSMRHVPGRFGLAHAYAALGQPGAARREYGLWRAACYATNDLYVVEYTTWAELRHAVLPYQADDPPERARLAAESARAWATVQDTVIAAPYPSQADLPVALVEGRWTEARRLAEAGVTFATIGHAQHAGAALGVLAWHQGTPDAAWARVRTLHPVGPNTAPGDCLFLPGQALQALAAALALDAGDLALAGDWIAAHGRWLDWSGAILWRAEHELLRARHARASGDPAGARAHAEAALTQATAPRQPLALLAAHRALGKLATASEHHTDAAAHLEVALALAEACAAPYERALCLLALAALRAATGHTTTATQTLAEARAILEPLGARPALARAAELAARLTAAPAPAPPALPFGLTAREAEVLRLVVQGLTNPQVADRLFVTPRTVNGHLTSIYTKLGVPGRAAAIRIALDHGLR